MKVVIKRPDMEAMEHEVKAFGFWSDEVRKNVPLNTKMTVFKTQGGTIQYELKNRNYWTILRETYGP